METGRSEAGPRRASASNTFGDSPLTPGASTLFVVDLTRVVKGLSEQDAEAFVKLARDRALPAGTPVYAPGDRQQGFWIAKKGLVEEYRVTPSGDRLPINRVAPGQIFGFASTGGRYCCFAETLEESVLGFLGFNAMEEAWRTIPRAASNLIELLATRLGDLESRLELLAFSGLRYRVAWTLLALSTTRGLRLTGITHEELAEWVVASRPKVSQVLEELQAVGLLVLSRGEIEIVRPLDLEDWASQQVNPA